jgi:DNA-directed RNA polymerase specialized sigma24 family protein
MADVTQILGRAAAGDRAAAEELLPFVYDELRRLAARQLRHEPAGLTLQPTALVHEAYLRLVHMRHICGWSSRAARPPQNPNGITAATSSSPRLRPCGAS